MAEVKRSAHVGCASPTLYDDDVQNWRGFRYKPETYLMSAKEKCVELLRDAESEAVVGLVIGAKESSKLINTFSNPVYALLTTLITRRSSRRGAQSHRQNLVRSVEATYGGDRRLFEEARKMWDTLCYDSDVKADVHDVSAQPVNVKMLGLLQMAVL